MCITIPFMLEQELLPKYDLKATRTIIQLKTTLFMLKVLLITTI